MPYIFGTSGSPSSERNGSLVDHGDGRYTYTFSKDLATATFPGGSTLVGYDATLTHRLGIQFSGSVNGRSLPALNFTSDFRPAGGALTRGRDVVSKNSCNECHRELRAHGSRVETKLCVTCHNPSMTDEDADFGRMIHSIHAAGMRSTAFALAGHDYSEVTYPQDLRNCLKCHDGTDADTPQGDSWRLNPTREACTGCHDAWSNAPHPDGLGGTQTDNSACHFCHSSSSITNVHATEDPTPNTPSVTAGLSSFTYDIKEVTVLSDFPVVTFRILRDGTPMNLSASSADRAGLTGSGPGFLMAWALPQDGFDGVADYNNRGRSAAQPATVSLASIQSLINAATPDGNGYYTITFPTAFPSGSGLRTVALQGYWSQQIQVPGDTGSSGTKTISVARHAISVEKAVEDEERRRVVDSAKCANCHEWFLGHGGSRVYATDVCVMCHVPNLTSSGRGTDLATYPNAPDNAFPPPGGDVDAANPLTYPEEGQSFKTLIHSIHASAKRENPFEFVRVRCSSSFSTACALYYDFSEVTFPGILSDCSTCHVDATRSTDAGYSVLLPEDALPTTIRITSDANGDDASPLAVRSARDSVPNATDRVITPVAAACIGCHDSDIAREHMEGHGARVDVARSDAEKGDYVETCTLCHGPGRTVDVELMHGF